MGAVKEHQSRRDFQDRANTGGGGAAAIVVEVGGVDVNLPWENGRGVVLRLGFIPHWFAIVRRPKSCGIVRQATLRSLEDRGKEKN